MKTIIAGSRTITDVRVVAEAIRLSGLSITEVVCGMARGVDLLGREWAIAGGVPVVEFPADWDKHGRRAGIYRNRLMAGYAEALVAVSHRQSTGTAHMIAAAVDLGLIVHAFEMADDGTLARMPLAGHV